jgi:Ion transport protein
MSLGQEQVKLAGIADGSKAAGSTLLVDNSVDSFLNVSSKHGSSLARPRASTQVIMTAECKQELESQRKAYVFLPWSRGYVFWFGFTVVWSIFTLLFETFAIAFLPGGGAPRDSIESILEYIFMVVFVVDILVQFNLAFRDEYDQVILDRGMIARKYLKKMFWVDFIGVFPFYLVALAARGEMGVDTLQTRYMQLLSLL